MEPIQYFDFAGKQFTLKKMQVIYLKVKGLKQPQIAGELGILPCTVKSYLEEIRYKLNLKLTEDLVTLGARCEKIELNGHYDGHYLFADYPKMEWDEDSRPIPKSSAPQDKDEDKGKDTAA